MNSPASIPPRPKRMLRPDGSPNIRRVGARARAVDDLYHRLMRAPWRAVLVAVLVLYAGVNMLFAVLFMLGGDCIDNARPGSFADAFFFSVQTMATIGYGYMRPTTAYAHLLVTLEALVGLIGTALVTGIFFAKFSRPSARVVFSQVAVVTLRDGVPSLMFRAANVRSNLMVEATISVVLARNEVTAEGESIRRFHDLKLLRNRNTSFALSWTVIHPITADSPLATETPESLANSTADIIASLTGVDLDSMQTVHARWAYNAEEVRWDHRLVDIISTDEDGTRVIDYRRFHDTAEVTGAQRLVSVPVMQPAGSTAATA